MNHPIRYINVFFECPKKPFGYGVSAHRLITAACELVGIKDIRVTIEGKYQKYVVQDITAINSETTKFFHIFLFFNVVI